MKLLAQGLFDVQTQESGLTDQIGVTPNNPNQVDLTTLPNLSWLVWGLFAVLLILTFGLLLGVIGYLLIVWYRHKDREAGSLEMVCLQVAVPRDNEVKIDAMEQIFNSIYSIKKGPKGPFGLLNWLQVQPHVSFEIVARKEDVRFYIVVPEKLRDLVEKQIHGGYPGAEIKIVDEPTIFDEAGKGEFAWLILRNASYNP